MYSLCEKQDLLNIPQQELVQDCVTRWGSTLTMLQRIQEEQDQITAVLIEGPNSHFMPEGGELTVIDASSQ